MECVFGSVGSDGQVTLNDWGHVVEACWSAIPEHVPESTLDLWVTMPNHLHGIVIVEAHRRSLGVIVGSFKSAVTKRIREMDARADEIVWQRNYYEHIIRDEDDRQRIRRYIETNPVRWAHRLRRS